jgi:hypothetical protein
MNDPIQPNGPRRAPSLWLPALITASLLPQVGAAQQEGDIVAKSRAAYAALTSYADSGTVIIESKVSGGPAIVEHHRFVTYYQAPRRFFHDFREDPKAGGDQVVVWCDGSDFNTWWSATKVHDRYEKGRGATAFAVTQLPTNGSVTQIPPLLFATAGLHGPLADFANYRMVATEEIAGRRHYKLSGDVTLAYQTGRGGRARATTVWIDAETLLVRKVVEETPPGLPGGTVQRVTTTFDPRANPSLGAERFRFLPPAG